MTRALLVTLLLVLPEIMGASTVAAQGTPPAPTPPSPGSYSPTLGQAQRQAEALVNAAFAKLNETLASRNITAASPQPATATTAFADDFDHPMLGGIGEWRDGEGWRKAEGFGSGGSAGWTITNATGAYGHLDTLLVSPAIDLSAYLPGSLPGASTGAFGVSPASAIMAACRTAVSAFNLLVHTSFNFLVQCSALEPALNIAAQFEAQCEQASSGQAVAVDRSKCDEVVRNLPASAIVRNLVLLSLRSRYQFSNGRDGAQVLVFAQDPRTHPNAGRLLQPVNGPPYARRVQSLDGPGLTGTSGWNATTFDLTSWATNTVWIGVRVATSPLTEKDPYYFESFDPAIPAGIAIDDVSITAPAYGSDAKVYAVEGPGFRADPTDHHDVVLPGTNVTMTAVVLHPAANDEVVNVTTTVTGTDEGSSIHQQERRLRPGEVWRVPIGFVAPAAEGAVVVVSVDAKAQPLYERGPTLDPTPNGHGSASVVTRTVRRFEASLRTSALLVDDNVPLTASAHVKNTGNVPVEVALDLNESFTRVGLPATALHAPKTLTVPAGETAIAAWDLTAAPRGAHNLTLWANATGLPPKLLPTEHFHVHASPPPVFFDKGPEPEPGWGGTDAAMPIPLDGSMWVARMTDLTSPVLQGRPPPGVGGGSGFRDLELSLRWMPLNVNEPPRIDIAYTQPATVADQHYNDISLVVWNTSLPLADEAFRLDENLTWHTSHFDVTPDAGPLYIDSWSAGGLVVRVMANSADPSGANNSGFFLDDLVLTGVPTGLDESYRMPLVHLTGEPTDDGTATAPSACPGLNCWVRLSAVDALTYATTYTHWNDKVDGTVPLLGKEPTLFTYVGKATDKVPGDASAPPGRDSDRLTTPVIHLVGADDPVLSFTHAYEFPGYPADIKGAKGASYTEQQVGYAQIQYRQDDGTWSGFYTIFPDDGSSDSYALTKIARSPSGIDRQPLDPSYAVGSGYFWPSPCIVPEVASCDADTLAWTRNFYDLSGTFVAVAYPPMEPTRATFHLKGQTNLAGIDLSDRDIRIGFRVAGTATKSLYNPTAHWWIGDVRVDPLSTFAIDGAVDDVHLDVPYDWRSLGLGPDTDVTINVTVRNAGLYATPFQLAIGVHAYKGDLLAPPQAFDLGVLAAGANKTVRVPWHVPAEEGRAYEIKTAIRVNEAGVADENPANDERVLGSQNDLRGESHPDLSVEGVIRPVAGRTGLPRYIGAVLRNIGNMPLDDISVTRTIEQLSRGRRIVRDITTFDLVDPLGADPKPVAIEQLHPRIGDKRADINDAFYTPLEEGEYAVTFKVSHTGADQDTRNDAFRGSLRARDPIYVDDFDDRLDVTTDAPDVWGIGEGFRSRGSLTAANATSGALPAGIDTAATTPVISLATAESASVNLYANYDLEKHYDAARLEVSSDGEHWLPVPPSGAGSEGGYSTAVVPSSPFADPDRPDLETRALSGDSRQLPVQIDGWTPMSFDLSAVPGLADDVVFKDLTAPLTSSTAPTLADEAEPYSTYQASMITDPLDPAGRWVAQNLTKMYAAREGEMWWSGFASHDAATVDATLSKQFTLSGASPDDRLRLSWWEMRSGSIGTSWEGTGGVYLTQVSQPTQAGVRQLADSATFHAKERVGPWTHVEGIIDHVDTSQPLTVAFDLRSHKAWTTDLGWAVEDIDLAVETLHDGTYLVGSRLTQDDEAEKASWQGTWTRVPSLPNSTIGWKSAPATTPDGLPRPTWRVDLPATGRKDADTRLVSPVVDLADLTSSRASLRLAHKFDLNNTEGLVPPRENGWVNQAHQGAEVEVQMFNRTTGQWDPWRTLWNVPPNRTMETRVTVPTLQGTPYNATFSDAGDTFERYPRVILQKIGAPDQWYLRPTVSNVSYAFTGVSRDTGPNGYEVDSFDLSPYVGERVRFGFHLWSSPVDPSARAHFWQLGKMEVIGTVLHANDVQLRLRLATDASNLDGHVAIDAVEVTGVQYRHSVGIALDSMQQRVDQDGFIVIRGNVTNHAAETRDLVGLGLVQDAFGSVVLVNGTQAGLDGSSRYALIETFWNLTPGGTPGSSRPFEIAIAPGKASGQHRIQLEIVEIDPAAVDLGFQRALDDVPGRARRDWFVDVVRTETYAFEDVTLSPRYLDMPGTLRISGALRSTGTRSQPIDINVGVFNANGALITSKPLHLLAPPLGLTRSFDIDGLKLDATGNDSIRITVSNHPEATWQGIVRVGRSDVAFLSSLEDGLPDWHPSDGGFRVVHDEAKFGASSLLLGVTDDEYTFGGRAQDQGTRREATITSPTIDLRNAPDDVLLEFWQKSRMGKEGSIMIRANVTGDHPCATGDLAAPLRGARPEWQLERVDLGAARCLDGTPLVGHIIEIVFVGTKVDDQGWRADGMSVSAGPTRILPAVLEYPLSDSAKKVYPFLIRNPGLAPRSYQIEVDEAISRLTPAQREWISFEPRSVDIGPGASAVVRLIVQPPTARGAFPQTLAVAVSAFELQQPFSRTSALATLDFEPRSRQDIAVNVLVDGKSPVGGEWSIEEGVPHEVSATILNLGSLPSHPTTVRTRLVETETGAEAFVHEEEIAGLTPYSAGEESVVVSTSWLPPFGHRGPHRLQVVVDPTRQQIDYDHGNDDVVATLNVTRLIRPDVLVDPKTVKLTSGDGRTLHETTPGTLVRLTGTIRNDGPAAAHDVVARIYAGSSVLKQEPLGTLAPGDSYVFKATALAPSNTTVYAIQATTPDLQLLTTNDQVTLELPVFPPELRITTDEPEVDVLPGAARTILFNVSNDGPYPLVISLDAVGLPGSVDLSAAHMALGPGETRNFTISIEPDPRHAAGTFQVAVHARRDSLEVGRSTIDVSVLPVPKADAVVYRSAGPPQAIALSFDVANLGNVAISGEAVLEDEHHNAIGRASLRNVRAGELAATELTATLSPRELPGIKNMTLVLKNGDDVVGSVPVSVDVLPWGRTHVRVEPVPTDGPARRFDLYVDYEGNEAIVREPRLFGIPAGTVAAFNASSLVLRPGSTQRLGVEIRLPSHVSPGLYTAVGQFVDPEARSSTPSALVDIPLDLRSSVIDIRGVDRTPKHPAVGGTAGWTVALRNVGDMPSTGVPVELYVDGVLTKIEHVDIPPLQERNVTLSWLTSAGSHAIVIAVDAHGAHREDTAAFGETLDVPVSLLGSAVKKGTPGVSVLALLVGAAAIAALGGRRPRRP